MIAIVTQSVLGLEGLNDKSYVEKKSFINLYDRKIELLYKNNTIKVT
jgi:hypothetical protein